MLIVVLRGPGRLLPPKVPCSQKCLQQFFVRLPRAHVHKEAQMRPMNKYRRPLVSYTLKVSTLAPESWAFNCPLIFFSPSLHIFFECCVCSCAFLPFTEIRAACRRSRCPPSLCSVFFQPNLKITCSPICAYQHQHHPHHCQSSTRTDIN